MIPAAPTRREFCAYAGQAASILAAAGLTACGSSPTSPSDIPQLGSVPASVSGRAVTVRIDATWPLAAVGSAAIAQASVGSFLIARTSQTAFNVVTAICTHEGCTVTGFT